MKLLWPIKQKYGRSLSWGDLIILAGNAAIESIGGPILGFCGGRLDNDDGFESIKLGPSKEQELLFPCEGENCDQVLYVNPEGPNGEPSPKKSASRIKDVFGRMGMNDSETVALISGGHTIGKCHGALPAGPGPAPKDAPEYPWPGKCGSGKGMATDTSGIELSWTTKPTYWDLEYFKNLDDLKWDLHKGSDNKYQWKSKDWGPQVISADGSKYETIGMLTTDLALKVDPENHELIKQFKTNSEAFNTAFKYAWYKLNTNDMGPRSRCVNEDVPQAQPFQNPLPDPPQVLPNFDQVKEKIEELLRNKRFLAGKFLRLAFQCMATFRKTDYRGGCNGARIRFLPEKDWPGNSNIENILYELSHIKEQTKDLSWVDLIILSGNTALEKVGGKAIKFCGGRTDALDGSGSQYLHPTITGELSDSLVYLKDWIEKLDLTKQEFAALYGLGYSVGDSGNCDGVFCGRDSKFSSSHMQISNVLFNELLSGNWHLQLPTINFGKYQAVKYSLYNVLTMQEMFFAFSFLVGFHLLGHFFTKQCTSDGFRGENWFNKLPHHHQNLVAHAIIFDYEVKLHGQYTPNSVGKLWNGEWRKLS